MEQAEDDGDPEARDLDNQKFWDKLLKGFVEMNKMIRAGAKKRGIDLDDPKLIAATEKKERAAKRLAAQNLPLAEVARAYMGATDKWFDEAKPLLEAKVAELNTQVQLEIGDPQSEVEKLSDLTDVIRWYQRFIYVKLRRAISGRARRDLEMNEEVRAILDDCDGSAKIALIAMDRSIAAWSGLREAFGEEDGDSILDLLAQLAKIRRETENLFPQARAFVRPGFDEPVKKPAARRLRRAH